MKLDSQNLYMSKAHARALQNSGRDFLRKEPLKVTTVRGGVILPAHENSSKLWADGGVIDSKGSFVEASGSGYLFGDKYDFDEHDIVEREEVVVFFGPFIAHWGHFICDLIGRMWYVKGNPRKYKIAYCGWDWRKNRGDIDGNFLELLELLGLKRSQLINIQQPTRFKKIIIPDLAFSGGNYYTAKFEKMISIIVANALEDKAEVPNKIYFSREKINNGKERGEKKLEEIFKSNGYTVLYPEELSVREQIRCFNKATEIAMVAGSISHNLMFARSKRTEAIILNKMSLVNNYQLVIDDMTKAKLTYIDSYFNPRQVLFGMGPFLLAKTKHLKRFLASKNYDAGNVLPVSIRDVWWYFEKYHEIYKVPANKKLLKSQNESIRQSKNQNKD